MRISFNTTVDPDKLETTNGYGYATDRMLTSLARLGYEVTVNDPKADVGICFNQPHHWKFYGRQYRIGYHPWESTQLLPPSLRTGGIDWKDAMNRCDEVWTPSPLIADWYNKYMNIDVPTYVYEHGVDDVWSPVEREAGTPFQFLHVGGEASRKGVRETITAFRAAFPNNEGEVQLNLKIISKGWQIGALRNINIINEKMDLADLIRMYHENHVFVYPSYGEGFGLTPLQAMATGMPTLTLPAWAPYARFLDPDLSIKSSLRASPWPALHPGNMYTPELNDVIAGMRKSYHYYNQATDYAQRMEPKLREYYNWDRLTQEVFSALESRLNH